MLKILVIEDDLDLNQLICNKLTTTGFSVLSVTNAVDALNLLDSHTVNLVLTDLMMPGIDGQTLIKQIREIFKHLPIIVATALGGISDKQTCFKAGADDYIVKPIDFTELQLRIEALLRRSNLVHQQQINYADLKLDFSTKTVFVKNTAVELTKKEFLILFMLVAHPHRIYSRDEMLNEIWEVNANCSDRTIDVHITNIREKLKASSIKLINVRGLGYKVE